MSKVNVTIVLDRSGSMQSAKDDHIGGLKSFIKDQQNQEGKVSFTFVQFDSHDPFELKYDGVDIDTINIEEIDLIPRGGTPLLDAIGKTVAHIEEQEKKNKSDQVMFMIITDGHDNNSGEWTRDQVKKSIESKQGDWQIMFLGANIDSFSEAGSLGLQHNQVINYVNNAHDVGQLYGSTSQKLRNTRSMVASGIAWPSAGRATAAWEIG